MPLRTDGPYTPAQALAYISTEIHKSFKPFFAGAGDEDNQKARELIQSVAIFGFLTDKMGVPIVQGDYDPLPGSGYISARTGEASSTLASEKVSAPDQR